MAKSQENTKYHISAKWFFYAGTFGTPKDGPLVFEGVRVSFDSKEDAVAFLVECFGCEKETTTKAGAYFPTGTYYLRHGEYSQPEFKVVKSRTK